jgi:hypothetical protein
MPRISKGQRALDRALKHREDIERLLATTPHWMLRGWFLDWAEGQLRRDRFYLFSENEHAVLAKELSSRMTPCEGWGGYTVAQLVRALTYRARLQRGTRRAAHDLQRETFRIAVVADAPTRRHLPTRRSAAAGESGARGLQRTSTKTNP